MKKYITFFVMLIVVFSLPILHTFAFSHEEYEIPVSDEIWKAVKHFSPDGEIQSVTYFSPDGAMFDEDSFRKAVRGKMQSKKIEPELSETLQFASPETLLRVIITLKGQPYWNVKKEIEENYRYQIEDLQNRIESMHWILNEKETEEIHKEVRSLNNRIIVEAYIDAKAKMETQQKALVSHIESIGGIVTHRYTIVNAISSLIPAREIEGLSTLQEIGRISEDRRLDAYLNVSTKAIFADRWWDKGLTGGIYSAGIVDSGMDQSHPAFAGKTFVSGTFHETALTDDCYADNPASIDDLSGHGTHVGGIVMSQGAADCPDCKGIAYGLNKTFNLKAAFLCSGGAAMYPSDAMAAVDWAESQADAPDVYNLSYGGQTPFDDDDFARFWDAVVSVNGKPVTVAAGNTGPYNALFNTPAISYNALTVANMDDRNTILRSGDWIANSSSRGPTAAGRKKPDIAAPGTSIRSANAFWEGAGDFVAYTGTSMAAPHVAGALVLLQNYMGSGTATALRQKALLISTSDSWSDQGTIDYPWDDEPVIGTHWDRTYGWGYINLDKAYIHRNDTFSESLTATNRYRLYKGQLPAGDKATVVWNRRAVYNDANYPTTWYALSNIDLYLRREADNTLLDSSTSVIDNVEQVASASTEDVVLKVKSTSSSIDGAASEPYGLAMNGNFSIPNFDVEFVRTATPFVCPNTTFDLKQTIMNYGDIFSHNHSISLTSPAEWQQNTSNPRTFGSIQPNRTGRVSWSLTSPASGEGSFSISGISNSYGETMTIPTITFNIGIKIPSFTDVSCSHPFYGWIEKMKEQGITSGCSAMHYCPDSLVTRMQMAVFMVRAMGQTPSAANYNAYFDDIANDWFAPYINKMYELGITAGCGTRLFCPFKVVKRAPAAVFIIRAF